VSLSLSGSDGFPAGTCDTRNIAIMVAGFCAMINLYAPQAILPLLSESFSAPPVRVALTVTATALAVGCIAPVAGAFSDAKGRKPVIIAGLILTALPTLACALVPTLDLLILFRFLQGLFMPAVFVATLAYVAEESAPHERGRVSALYVTSNVLGGFAGRMIGSAAVEWGDWHLAFVTLGGLNLLGAALVRLLMPPSQNFKGSASLARSVASIPLHLCNRQLLSCFAIGFGVLFSQVAVFTYLTFHLAGPPFFYGPLVLGGLFVSYLIGAAATPFAGRFVDRFGHRRVLRGATVVASLGIVLTLLPALAVILVGLSILCLAMFLCQSVTTSYVGLAATQDRSSAAGLYLAFYYAGGAVGAFLPGFAYLRGGWTSCAILAVAIQTCIGLLSTYAWRSTKMA